MIIHLIVALVYNKSITQQHYNIPLVVGTPQHYAIYSKIIHLIMALVYNKL